MISNPILRGFHPDPSIVRAGEDYYIATSTFEWFPGVLIHHSRDLVHWQPLTAALNRPSQLHMEGNVDSGGVWAPCLSYSDDIFYLVYSDVKSRMGAFKDTPNYLVTATDIRGPWSEPVYLNSSGFDPSLFHDDDGRKWLVNMLWDHRKGTNSFAGIMLQEYSVAERRLIGPKTNIFKGTELRLTEGPHLYKRNGYYYLLTAEGGTQYEHAVTMARSATLEGPYEVDPHNPVLTSAGKSELLLQKAGHASLVETQTGEWYMVHLTGRPVRDRYCTLGRETAIQRCHWTEDGWLAVEGGDAAPLERVRPPRLPAHPFPPPPETDHFDSGKLGLQWCTLRVTAEEHWLSLTERPGRLRLRGRESTSSTHRQSLVARRQQSMNCEAETELEFAPEHFQQMAGLIVYYDTRDYIYLRITHHEEQGVVIGLVQSVNGAYNELLERDIPIGGGPCGLKVRINRDQASFMYKEYGQQWRPVGPLLDVAHLSDECSDYIRFTGTFIGVCVQDLSGEMKYADFDYFRYTELEP